LRVHQGRGAGRGWCSRPSGRRACSCPCTRCAHGHRHRLSPCPLGPQPAVGQLPPLHLQRIVLFHRTTMITEIYGTGGLWDSRATAVLLGGRLLQALWSTTGSRGLSSRDLRDGPFSSATRLASSPAAISPSATSSAPCSLAKVTRRVWLSRVPSMWAGQTARKPAWPSAAPRSSPGVASGPSCGAAGSGRAADHGRDR